MSIKKFSMLASTIALAATFTTPVLADAADNAIKARQAYYQVVVFNFGQVVGMAKGEIAYDADTAKNAATNLQALSKMHLVPLFPAGSDNVAKKGKTRALPKIWEEFPAVAKIIGEWQGAIDGLVKVAGDGQGALGPAVGAVGKQCGACHETYRAKNF